jgi:hypothetical protein
MKASLSSGRTRPPRFGERCDRSGTSQSLRANHDRSGQLGKETHGSAGNSLAIVPDHRRSDSAAVWQACAACRLRASVAWEEHRQALPARSQRLGKADRNWDVVRRQAALDHISPLQPLILILGLCGKSRTQNLFGLWFLDSDFWFLYSLKRSLQHPLKLTLCFEEIYPLTSWL